MADEWDVIELPEDALPSIDELSGDLRMLAEIPGVGVRLALRIAQVFGGTPIRVWGVGKWIRRERDRCIRREYDAGRPVVELARKYNRSDRRIWDILGAPEPDERQLKLWE